MEERRETLVFFSSFVAVRLTCFWQRRETRLSSEKALQTLTTIYIYIYIYLLINYLPVFTVPEKNQKTPGQEQEKKIYLESRSRGKRKKFFGVKKKEKTNLVLLLEKNQGVQSQWPKENQKTLREYCNAIITKVLNIKQWSQL